MKQYIFTALTAVLFAANVSPAFAGGWTIMTADDYEDNTGYNSCLELDSLENPHIVYNRSNPMRELAYATINFHSAHPQWYTHTITDSWGGFAFALDDNDMPHISFYNRYFRALLYAYYDSEGWVITPVDRYANIMSRTSIAIDQEGNPHISYYDSLNGDLKYARWNGSSWVISVVDSVGDVGKFCSLELSSNDYPRISYKDDTNYWLKYALWNGSSWYTFKVDDVSFTGGDCINDLELDANDRPHIAYEGHPAPVTDSLKYAYWPGRVWVKNTVDDDASQISGISLALDSNSYAHISYVDTETDDLKYAYRYGGYSWAVSVVADNATFNGTSIEVNSEDEPRISFDMYSGCSIHHLGYAYYESVIKKGEMASPQPLAFALGPATPNPMSDTATVTFALPYACEVELSLYDIKGRKIQTLASGYFEPGEHKAEISG
ncbi:MAG: hypothetical protein GY771_08970, partial [bacterium]|nr:hypothetical protein [bacterium]